MGPLKAAVGVADAAAVVWPPEGGPHVELIQADILLFLLFDVFPDHRFVSPYGRDEIPPCPEVLPYEVALPLPVDPGRVDRTLPLMKPITCETGYFGRIEIIT
jgi:hypothetical protein